MIASYSSLLCSGSLQQNDTGCPSLLRQRLPAGIELWWQTECTSTSSELRDRIAGYEAGLDVPLALLLGTEHQTAGRGTRMREWLQGGPGQDIALSLALRLDALPAGCPALDPRLPLLAAVLAARAIEPPGLRVRVKWPNDLLIGDPPAKVGGLLCESGRGWLIIGVGVNVNSRTADYAGLRLTTLHDALGQQQDRPALALRLALGLCQLGWLDPAAPCPSADELLAEWAARDLTGGTGYRLLRGAGIAVEALGVDLGSGSLRCRDAEGREYLVQSYGELEALPR